MRLPRKWKLRSLRRVGASGGRGVSRHFSSGRLGATSRLSHRGTIGAASCSRQLAAMGPGETGVYPHLSGEQSVASERSRRRLRSAVLPGVATVVHSTGLPRRRQCCRLRDSTPAEARNSEQQTRPGGIGVGALSKRVGRCTGRPPSRWRVMWRRGRCRVSLFVLLCIPNTATCDISFGCARLIPGLSAVLKRRSVSQCHRR